MQKSRTKKEIPKKYQDLPMCMGVSDIAAVLGVSKPVAYELVNRDDFPSIRLGCNGSQRKIIVPRDRFLKWLYDEDYEAITGDKESPGVAI